MKSLFAAAALSLAMIAAPACASTDTAELVTVPPAPAGKALVVFFRPGGFAGSAISCAVSEDGTKISSLPPKHFFILVAEPGKHTYTVSSEATDKTFLTLKPGDTVYAKCTIAPGFFAGHPKMEVTTEQDFSSKEWKEVKPESAGPNVMTDAQIKAALAAPAATTPAATTAPVTTPEPTAPAPASAAPTAPTSH